MTAKSIIAKTIVEKAKTDIQMLQSKQSEANRNIIFNIIEAVRKVCGHSDANLLIKEYNLAQVYSVEETVLN